MLAVDRRGGTVFLADGVGMVGISKRLHIGGTYLRRERIRRKSPTPECTIDDGFGNRGSGCAPGAAAAARATTRASSRARTSASARCHTVSVGRMLSSTASRSAPIGMIERHAIGNAAAAVSPGDREAQESKPFHHGHHIARH